MTEHKLSEQEMQEIREEAEKVFPLPDDKLRGTHSYKLAANQIQGLRDAHFDGQVAALTRERERVKGTTEERGIALVNELKVRTELALKEGSPYHETGPARTMAFTNGWKSCKEYFKIN